MFVFNVVVLAVDAFSVVVVPVVDVVIDVEFNVVVVFNVGRMISF